MRPLHAGATSVSWARVIREHRAALIPLAVVIAVNVVLLAAVVLPLSRRVSANEQRAQAAARSETAAHMEFQRAGAEREANSRATADLKTFYEQVLPKDVASARRIVQIKFQQTARQHSVQYKRMSADQEAVRGSSLERITASAMLSGDYDDIRSLIYAMETAPDFVVIDNMDLAEGALANEPLSLSLELSTYFLAARPAADRSRLPNSDGR